MAAASATGDSRANGAGSESPEKGSACPTCGEDLTGLKRVLAKLRREKIELKAKVHEFEPYRQVATGEVSTLVKEQRRAIKYLKKERRALREALGRTGSARGHLPHHGDSPAKRGPPVPRANGRPGQQTGAIASRAAGRFPREG